MNLAYGNYLSNELNLNAGSGYVQGATDNVTGQISINADSAHLASASKDMLLGNDLVNGDPTYVNTAGDITLNGAVTSSGANLAIIASGNINVVNGSTASISTQGTTSAGGNLVMIAGLGSNVTGGGSVANPLILPGGSQATSTVTVNLGATSGNAGGNIDLVNGNTGLTTGSNVITTAGNGTNTAGGSVTLIAVPNSITGSGGQILTSNGTTSFGIDTSGTGSAYNGNVLIVAGGLSSGLAVELGAVTTTSANETGGGGNVSIYSALPNVQTVNFDTTGTQSAAITVNTSNLITSDIVINGNITAPNVTASGIVTLATGGQILTATNTVTGNTLNVTDGLGSFGSLGANVSVDVSYLGVNVANGSSYIFSPGSVTINTSTVSAAGGFFYLHSNDNITLNGTISAGSANGSGIIGLVTTTGNINQNSNADVLTAGMVGLTANSVIGSITNNIYIDTANASIVVATTGLANVYVSDNYTGNVNFTGATTSTTSGNFDFSTLGNLVINNNFNIGADNSASVLQLQANGSIIQGSVPPNTPYILTAGTVNLLTNGGNIGSLNNNVVIDADTVNISTGGVTGSSYVFDNSPNDILINQAIVGSASNDVFAFGGSNGATTYITEATGLVITAGQVIIASVNGNIGLGSSLFNINSNLVTLNATSNNVYVNDTASGNITLTNVLAQGNNVGNAAAGLFEFNANNTSVAGNVETATASNIAAPQIALTSAIGSIGTSSSALNVNTNIPTPGVTPQYLSLTSASGAYVADSSTNSLSLMASNVGNNQALELSNAGAIVVSGLVQAGSDNGTGSISLTVNGTGTVTSLATGDNLQASNVSVTTTGGNIGSSATSPLLVDAALLSVNTGLTVNTASAYVSNAYTGQMDLGTSQVGNSGTLDVVATGGILVSGFVTAGSASGTGVIDLSANGVGSISSIASLTAGTINLATVDGNIGNSGNAILVDTSTLSINTGSVSSVASAYVTDSYTGSLSLNASTVGASGSLTVDTAGSMLVNGNITAGADSGLGIINLTTSGTGNLTQASTNDVVTAGEVNLTTSGANIGTFLNNFYVDANNVGISTGGVTGSSYVFDNSANNTTIILANTGVANGDIFEFSANNSNPDISGVLTGILTGTGVTVTAPQVIMVSQSGFVGTSSNLVSIDSNLVTLNGLINVFANDSASGNILLTTVTAGFFPITNSALNTYEINATNTNSAGNLNTDTSVGANITASSIILSSALGSIGSSSNNLAIDTGLNLTVTANQSAYISDASAVLVNLNASSVGNNQTFTLSNTGTINVIGLVSAGSDTGSGTINLTATGTGLITSLATGDNLQAGFVNLVTTGGNIGSSSSNVFVDTTNLSVNTSNSVTSASGYVSDVNTGSLNLNASSVGSSGSLIVAAANSIVVNGLVTAGPDNGTGSLSLIANGTGSITQSGNTNFLVAGSVNLQTNGVSIAAINNPILVDSDNVGISTGGATGSAFVLDYSANTINITNANTGVASGDVFGFAGYNGPTTNLLTSAGVVVLAPQAIIVSINGNIGSASSLFALNSTTVTLNATSNNVYATDSGSGSITLATVNEQGNLVANSAAGLYQFNATNGSIFTATGSSIDSPSINLSSSFGSIGSNSQYVEINTNQLTQSSSNLTLNSALGAYVVDSSTNPLNLQASNVGNNQTLTLTNDNAIVISGVISAGSDTGTGVINLITSGLAGTITAASTSDVLIAGQVNLSTSGANIGSSTTALAINANTFSFNTGSLVPSTSVYVSDAYTGNLTLTNSSVGSSGTLSLSNAGGILVGGLITAGADSGSGVIDLTAGGTGNITTLASGDVLTAGEVNLVTTGGNIGVSSLNTVLVDTNNLSVNTGNTVTTASAYLTDISAGNVNLNASSVGSAGTLDLTTANGIVVNGIVTAGFDIGSGVINLTAGGTGAITQPSILNNLRAGSISLVTAGGNIGSLNNDISVDSNSISISTGGATGSAYVFDSSPNTITINQAMVGSASGDIFAFAGFNSSTTNIVEGFGVVITAPQVVVASVNGNIGTGTNLFNINSNLVTLNATSNNVYANDSASGAIVLTNFNGQGNNVGNAAAGLFEFNANNTSVAGNIETATGSNIAAPAIILSSSLGSIGSSSSAVNVNTSELTMTSSSLTLNAAQNAYVVDTSTNLLYLMASSVGLNNTLSLSNTNSISVAGMVTAGSDSGTGVIDLSVSGSASTINSGLANYILQAGTLNLATAGGSIGANTTPLATDTNNLSVTTGGVNGSAYLNDISANTVVLGPVLIGTGTNVFALSANNSATTGIVLATGTQLTVPSLVLSSVAGNLGTNSAALDFNANNVTLSAGNGNVYANDSALGTITLQNFTLGNSALTNFAIGVYDLNASNTTASGNIVSAAGASVTAQTVILGSVLGSIGSSLNSLSVNTDILTLNSTQNVYVADSSVNTLVLNASSAGASYVFSLSNAGGILVSGLITAGSDSGSGVIDLSAGGSGTITQALSTDLLTAGSVNLTTAGGNIASLQNSLNIDANTLSANTGNTVANASAYLSDSFTGNTTLNASGVGSAGTLTITVANGLVVNGLISA